MTSRKYFKWMGKYWSCSNERLEDLQYTIEQNKPFDMEDCRELAGRPKMTVPVIFLADGRNDPVAQ